MLSHSHQYQKQLESKQVKALAAHNFSLKSGCIPYALAELWILGFI
jgi:hypothetical protein